MTSLIAWIAVDSRGPSSLYFASDSRITWRPFERWDSGQKLFCGHDYPEIFGYAGDVVFPFIFLSQAARLLPSSVNTASDVRHETFVRMAVGALELYPAAHRNHFSLLHGVREGHGMATRFHLWHERWSPEDGWQDSKIVLPSHSAMAIALGSGKEQAIKQNVRWKATAIGRTSRAVFSAFCDALRERRDPLSGGAPQIVGLYREQNGKCFGVLHEGNRFVSGLPINQTTAAEIPIEWRNNLFERCDPVSMKPVENAQRHARPRELSP